MEKLSKKLKDDMAVAENLFKTWMDEMQNMCMVAAFRKEQELMAALQGTLMKSQKSITDMLHDLSLHLSSNPEPSPASDTAPLPASGNRMAASFPRMTVPSPPTVFQSASAKIGSPMAVSNTPIVSNGEGKDRHVFMEKYTVPLPSDWRSGKPAGSAAGPLMSERLRQKPSMNGDLPFSSDENDEVERENIHQQNKVFLLNIARDSTAKSLAKYFEEYGSVVDVKIFRFSNGDSRGQGWIEFLNESQARSVIKSSPHHVDGRPVEAKAFIQRDRTGMKDQQKPPKTFQIFLGGIPSHLSREEVIEELNQHVKVRDLRLVSERGYAYLDVENEKDIEDILKFRRIKIGEKLVRHGGWILESLFD